MWKKTFLQLMFPMMLMADGDPVAGGPPAGDANAPQGGKEGTPSEIEELRAQLATERAEKQRLSEEKRAKEAELEESRLGKLKEQNDWQKIAQEFEGKYKEEKNAREGMSKAMIADRKMTAMREAAMKSGILSSALDDLDLLDFPEVKVETTSTGRVNVLGTESAIQRLKGLRPHWFGKPTPNVNGGAPRVDESGEGEKTGVELRKQLLELETAARKSGDWSKVDQFHKANGAKLRSQ